MSCRNNQDSATRNGKKGDRPLTSNCKSNCPGRKKQCPGANKCPFHDDSNGNPSVPRDDKCETSDAQRNATGMKVDTCTASVGCPANSPLVIQAPTDSKSPKTDLRIELYIHQLPTSRKNSQDVPRTDERGSLDSRKRRTSKESKKNEISQSSEDIRQREVEAQILFIREEETDKNDESRVRINSDQKSGSPPVDLMDAEKIEVETSSTKEKPNEESIDNNRSGVPKSPLPTENDPPEEERRNEVQLISDEKQEEINEAADNTSDNQSSIDLNDAMIEESIVVEKAAQLQSAPRRPSNYVDVPQSNDGSSFNAKNNKATDTEEDGNLNGWNIPVKDMVDVSTQIELA